MNEGESRGQFKYQSKFSSNANSKQYTRFPLLEIRDHNNIEKGNKVGYRFGTPKSLFKNHGKKQQISTNPLGSSDHKQCDPVEHMFPPDPPEKFTGVQFIPSNQNDINISIELEPLVIRRPIQWF